MFIETEQIFFKIMRVWKVPFDFQFKTEIKNKKFVNFDFYLNIEFCILTAKPNIQY